MRNNYAFARLVNSRCRPGSEVSGLESIVISAQRTNSHVDVVFNQPAHDFDMMSDTTAGSTTSPLTEPSITDQPKCARRLRELCPGKASANTQDDDVEFACGDVKDPWEAAALLPEERSRSCSADVRMALTYSEAQADQIEVNMEREIVRTEAFLSRAEDMVRLMETQGAIQIGHLKELQDLAEGHRDMLLGMRACVCACVVCMW